jgi:hypothetical protein
VCAKFGEDRAIFVNLTFDLNYNDLDLCQIRPLSGTPGVRLHVCAKFRDDGAIFVNLTYFAVKTKLFSSEETISKKAKLGIKSLYFV